MQTYVNACAILDQVKNTVLFAEGDNNDLMINENFVKKVEEIIHNQYYVYDKTYVPSNESDQQSQIPLVIVGKESVDAAWKWYEHHLAIATQLLTIDHRFTGKLVGTAPPSLNRQSTLKQLIMYNDYNIFPLSTITDKHPETGKT